MDIQFHEFFFWEADFDDFSHLNTSENWCDVFKYTRPQLMIFHFFVGGWPNLDEIFFGRF